jgi:hypothetical protein
LRALTTLLTRKLTLTPGVSQIAEPILALGLPFTTLAFLEVTQASISKQLRIKRAETNLEQLQAMDTQLDIQWQRTHSIKWCV